MNFSAIKFNDIANGQGIRTTLFVSGCSHHCKGCHNPQTWNENNGQLFDEKIKEKIFNEFEKYYISGLTLSGGDPLYCNNLNDVYNLVTEFKKKYPNKTIWIYSGYTWEEICEEKCSVLEEHFIMRQAILSQCDVFVDGRYNEELKDITLKWRGSSNQRVIDIKESIKEGKIILYCD